MIYLIANWKSNKTLKEVDAWVGSFAGFEINDKIKVVVCPPFPYGLQVYGLLQEKGVDFATGLQDVSPFPFGAYTGAVTVEQIAEFAEYAIVGHSERRKYFHETHQEIANKVDRLIEHELQPILCVDEPYYKQQLAAIKSEHYKKLIVAYEPLEAIGSGNPDTPEHANEVAEKILELIDGKVPILYGGSVKADNIEDFVNIETISGALVGGASLDPDKWKAIIEAVR